MKALGYIGAFLGGAIAGSALGLIFAPEKGEDTRSKIADAVDNFCSKHNIKLSKKDVDDLVETKAKGWYLVCVDGYPLGWGKLANGTLKNKYLPGWRLNS